MKNIIILSLTLVLGLQTASASEKWIRFNLNFGFLKGGEAEITITDTTFNGKPAIHYHVMGRTTGLADKLYGVHDIYETTVDAQTHLPLKTIRNVQEGSYRRYNETLFYHDTDSIYSQRSGWRKVPDNLLDIISVFFYFINVNDIDQMHSGDGIIYPTLNADKISNVMIKFLREERIKTDIGEIDSYVLRPTVEKGKVLKRSNGINFYVSKKKKIPVFIEFEMRVGSLKAVLKEYTIDGIPQTEL